MHSAGVTHAWPISRSLSIRPSTVALPFFPDSLALRNTETTYSIPSRRQTYCNIVDILFYVVVYVHGTYVLTAQESCLYCGEVLSLGSCLFFRSGFLALVDHAVESTIWELCLLHFDLHQERERRPRVSLNTHFVLNIVAEQRSHTVAGRRTVDSRTGFDSYSTLK